MKNCNLPLWYVDPSFYPEASFSKRKRKAGYTFLNFSFVSFNGNDVLFPFKIIFESVVDCTPSLLRGIQISVVLFQDIESNLRFYFHLEWLNSFIDLSKIVAAWKSK